MNFTSSVEKSDAIFLMKSSSLKEEVVACSVVISTVGSAVVSTEVVALVNEFSELCSLLLFAPHAEQATAIDKAIINAKTFFIKYHLVN